MAANVINQLTTSNTFQQWLTSSQQLIGVSNLLTNGGGNTFYANTRLEVGGSDGTLNVVTGASIVELRANDSFFTNTTTQNAYISFLSVDQVQSNTILIQGADFDTSTIQILSADQSTLNVTSINTSTIAQSTITDLTAGELTVTTDVDIGGNIIVSGSSTVNGSSIVVGNSTVSGNLSVTGNQTVTGNTTFSGNVVTNNIVIFNNNTVFNKNYVEKHQYVDVVANTLTINVSSGSVFTANVSNVVSNVVIQDYPVNAGALSFTLIINVGAIPPVITWPAQFKWQQNTAPELSVGQGDVDIFTFVTYDGGNNWYSVVVGQGF
jgi:hypothetical protein